ncbi:MAG: hypothetical protein B6D68_03580 [spirochete symbiont of Stewartia floridana]|nr:MAG: hypothetical protein B6D68_03580 [spirochete symbiont of Stewartia floridana]
MTPNDLTVIHASNDLPDWLAADENSGAISGTPSAVQAATSATITVTGTGNYTGSIDVMVSIEVLAYNIGDTGPAGGRIFYENANHATDGWRYLEAAPKVLANPD